MNFKINKGDPYVMALFGITDGKMENTVESIIYFLFGWVLIIVDLLEWIVTRPAAIARWYHQTKEDILEAVGW